MQACHIRWIVAHDLLRHALRVILRLRRRDAGPQTADHVVAPIRFVRS
jgi:hypothetical protein